MSIEENFVLQNPQGLVHSESSPSSESQNTALFNFYWQAAEIVRQSEKQPGKVKLQKKLDKLRSIDSLDRMSNLKFLFDDFDGSVNADPAQFLQRTERAFIMKQLVTDTQKCNMFALQMKPGSAAGHWFTQLQNENPITKVTKDLAKLLTASFGAEVKENSEVNNLDHWILLKAEFTKKWVKDNDQQLRLKLNQLRMIDDQRVEEFVLQFQGLVNQIRNPPMHPKEQLNIFIPKLVPFIRDQVRLQNPSDFEEAVDKARIVQGNIDLAESEAVDGYGPRNNRRNNTGKINEISEVQKESSLEEKLTQAIRSTMKETIAPINDRLERIEKDLSSFKNFVRMNYVRRNNPNNGFNRNQSNNSGARCHSCGQVGHFIANCPNRRNTPNAGPGSPPAVGPNQAERKPTYNNNASNNGRNSNQRNNGNGPRTNTNIIENDNNDDSYYNGSEEVYPNNLDADYYNSDQEFEEENSNTHSVELESDHTFQRGLNCKESSSIINSATSVGNKVDRYPLHTVASIHGVKTSVIIDTGAIISLISSLLLAKLPPEIQKRLKACQPNEVNLKSASGNLLKKLGILRVDVRLNDVAVGKITFIVIENLNSEVIIGTNTLKELFGAIDLNNKTMVYIGKDKSKAPITIKLKSTTEDEKTQLLVGSIYLTKKEVIQPNSAVYTTSTKIKGLGNFRDTYIAKLKQNKQEQYEAPILVIEADEKTRMNVAKGLTLINSVSIATDEVLNVKQPVPVHLLNRTKQAIVLMPGTRLGRVDAVDQRLVKPLVY
jgi:hypothetical protein